MQNNQDINFTLTNIFENAKNAIKEALSRKKTKQHYADTIVLNLKRELLLLQRSGNDTFMPNKWSLPGGKIEQGEDPLTAAKRECWEETGLSEDRDFTHLEDITHSDGSVSHYFLTFTKLSDVEYLLLDNEEHFRYEWVPLDRVGEYDLLLDLGDTLSKLQDKIAECYIPQPTISDLQLDHYINTNRIPELMGNVNDAYNTNLITQLEFVNFTKSLYTKALYALQKAFDEDLISTNEYMMAKSLDREILSSFFKGEYSEELLKGREAIGSTKNWGGRNYIKTANGWKYVRQVGLNKNLQYYKNIAHLDSQGLAEKQFPKADIEHARKYYAEQRTHSTPSHSGKYSTATDAELDALYTSHSPGGRSAATEEFPEIHKELLRREKDPNSKFYAGAKEDLLQSFRTEYAAAQDKDAVIDKYMNMKTDAFDSDDLNEIIDEIEAYQEYNSAYGDAKFSTKEKATNPAGQLTKPQNYSVIAMNDGSFVRTTNNRASIFEKQGDGRIIGKFDPNGYFNERKEDSTIQDLKNRK